MTDHVVFVVAEEVNVLDRGFVRGVHQYLPPLHCMGARMTESGEWKGATLTLGDSEPDLDGAVTGGRGKALAALRPLI